MSLLLGVALVLGVRSAAGAPGSLDPSFSGSGVVTTAVGTSADQANALALQPDGKIIAAGFSQGSTLDFALVRYSPDGSLDTGFGSGGKVTTAVGASLTSLALQPDGKIVAAGRGWNGSNYVFELARYLPNGSLDTSFGNGGIVVTAVPSADAGIFAVALQPDGKIVVAGDVYSVFDEFALARYEPNGSLDTSFGSGGTVETAFTSANAVASGLALQSNGKIVVAGYSSPDPRHTSFALARFNPNGSLDTGFGSGGKLTTSIGGSDDEAFAVALQPDGEIVVAGESYVSPQYRFALARYKPDGSLDVSFGSGGTVTTAVANASPGDYAYALALQPDGKIVAAGDAYGGLGYEFALARYNANGSLDSSYGSGGKLTTTIGAGADAHAIALQPDGKAVVAGDALINSHQEFALARYRGSTLTVRKTGRGAGTVSSTPAGISCGSVCTAPFAAVPVTLAASPTAGSTFTGWSGGGCSGTSTCRIQLSADQSVTANFSLEPCLVPKLTGKTLSAAKRSLTAHDCRVGKIKHAKSRKVKKGRVISQKPKAGSRLRHGAKVNLVVSKGRR